MRWRGPSLVLAVCAIVPLLTAATTPKAPSMSFDVTPTEIGCYTGQVPVQVLASWHIVHRVTSATISGGVDDVGTPLPPMELSIVRGKRGIVGSHKLYVPCSATAETLTLTAVGPGGTTTRVATVNENRAD